MTKDFANVALMFTDKIYLATLIKDLELNTPISTRQWTMLIGVITYIVLLMSDLI